MPRALIIDDEPDFQKVMERLLERKGYSVTKAYDASDGLIKAQEEVPDVVLLDVMLPGTNGWEVGKKLKENPLTKDIPIIVLSVVAEDKNRWKSFKYSGAEWHVSKPFDTDLLIWIIDLASSRKKGEEIQKALHDAVNIDRRMKKAYDMINPKLLDHKYDILG